MCPLSNAARRSRSEVVQAGSFQGKRMNEDQQGQAKSVGATRTPEIQPLDSSLASTQRKVRLGFAFALTCLVIVGIISYLSVVRLNELTGWVKHTQEVLGSLDSLLAAVTDSETAERGFVITGDDTYLDPYRQASEFVAFRLKRLRELTADNSIQRERVDRVEPLVTDRISNLRAVIELRQTQGFTAAQSEILTGKGKRFHDSIRVLIDQMKGTEESLLAAREREAAESSNITRAVIVGAGLLAFALVGFALAAMRRDFAARARAERGLREANNLLEARVQERTAELSQLASIVESSDDAIASKTLEGLITSWNAGAERLFGYAAAEVLGKPMALLIPPERADEEPTILARIARGEKTDHFDTVRVTKDGRNLNVSVTISPIRDAQGRIVGASKIARDTTERKLAERKVQAQLGRLNLLQQVTRAIGERQDLRSIFQVVIRTLEERLPVDFCCICLYDPIDNDLTVTSIGSRSSALAMELAMSEQAHVAIDENGLSQCVRGRLVYEPDINEVAFPFPQRLAGGGLRSMVAAPLLVESKVFGVLIAARIQAHSFSSGECEFLKQASEHVALAAHQAQLHGALQQAYDDLRQTQNAVMQQERLLALGQMASGIAHDINNAISPVMLYTESLLERETGLSPQARGYLETIQRAVDDVAQTVARMREFYRQREPQMTLVPVNLNNLVKQVVDLTRARWSDMAQQRGIAIEMRAELAEGPPDIMGAENEIREALTNLIFNAVDAMPNGGPLTVRTRVIGEQAPESQQPQVAKSVEVEIIDSGVGMDEETRSRCLEPFFTTKGERGTGLGLAMVYGTIQRHSADIEIESTVGVGTTMRLRFAVPTKPVVGAITSTAPSAVSPQRILIVDDDPLILKSLREVLEAEGHNITATDGGQAGIDTFLASRSQDSSFSIVITDLGMPHVDGRKVAAAIKSAEPSTIVLMLTGWGQRMVTEGDIPAHVDQVLSKPPKLRELREALSKCLEARRSEFAKVRTKKGAK